MTFWVLKGRKNLPRYLVDEVQEVYRLQGVKINDKHIEVIVRQMLRRVRVKEVGDTDFLVGEQIERIFLPRRKHERVIQAGGTPAVGEPLLLGITKGVALNGFVYQRGEFSGNNQGAYRGLDLREDRFSLRGLKENVIMGRLIPAGTGLAGIRTSGWLTTSGRKRQRPPHVRQERRQARRELSRHRANLKMSRCRTGIVRVDRHSGSGGSATAGQKRDDHLLSSYYRGRKPFCSELFLSGAGNLNSAP